MTAAPMPIPILGEAFFVEEGASKKSLLLGPARIAWSAAPGQSGNCIIAAHRDTHFRVSKDVKPDDPIILERYEQTYRYRVVKLAIDCACSTSFLESLEVFEDTNSN